MSNTLFIHFTEFRTANGSTYGYTASDSDNRDYDDSWGSVEDFLAEFPTADTLVAHVVDIFEYDEDEVPHVNVLFPRD